MHGRAVLSLCNLRLLDLKQRLMYLRDYEQARHGSPAGLYLWQIEPGVCAMVPIQVTTGRTGSWGADRACMGMNSALQPLDEKFPVNFLLFTESRNLALLLVARASLTSPEPPAVQLHLGMICDMHLDSSAAP